MGFTNRLILILSIMAALSFGLSFYLSKYHKDPVAVITEKSYGCFGSGYRQLYFLYGDTSMVVRLKQDYGKTKEVAIKKSQLKIVENFVRELRRLEKEGECTSVYYYKAFYKGQTIRGQDASCRWKGFENLVQEFFKDEKYISKVPQSRSLLLCPFVGRNLVRSGVLLRKSYLL